MEPFFKITFILVVLCYPDISNFTFQNVKNLKCRNFLIDFLDELGNFKQKNFTLQNVNKSYEEIIDMWWYFQELE